ncbi:MAG: MMPL family transporter [Nocardioidaceae bacterium]|nr:MMPL family transporter [Nocardioidaceae bacterium]
MFDALGGLVYHRRWFVLGAAAAFVGIAVVWGTGVFAALTSGGFEDRDSESYRGQTLLDERFGREGPDVVVLYTSEERTIDDPVFRDAVTETLDALPADKVASLASYYSTGSPQFVSKENHATYAAIQLSGDTEEDREANLAAIRDEFDAPGLQTQLGGSAAVGLDIGEQVGEDIARAEMMSMPVVLVLMVIIFGSLVAASLPLLIGGLAILGSFTLLRVLSIYTDVSVFSINIVTFLGLGLAIDYSLFMLSRFREELPRHSGDIEQALRATTSTAGRTVAFSGVTVAISLASLLLFPQVFLRSMGFGGMAAVLVAMTAALTVLPALLAVLGHRVNALSVRPLLRRITHRGADAPTMPTAHDPAAIHSSGAWSRIAHSVMRRPVLYAVTIAIGLLLLGTPFLNVKFGGIDERALPADAESRVVTEALDRDFTRNDTAAERIAVVYDEAVDRKEVDSYVSQVNLVPGVAEATVTGVRGDTADVSVRYTGDPISTAGRTTTTQIRALDPPSGARTMTTGESATLVDLLSSLEQRLPWAALLVTLVTLVLLFFAFGSVVLPVKALVMNIFSLSATFGALVWIFQYGNLAELLGFTPTGTLEATQPILVLAIAFGLSMDYEVFLLSRIREEWDATRDNTLAVANGLQRTGAIITSAALLLVLVIGAFATSGITFIKLIGVGMIIAIIVDATIVRALLVPATMRLLGNANWWAPRPLKRVYDRYGLKES